MRGLQMREKFHYYAAYFGSRRNQDDVQPALLIVTNSPYRENAIWEDLEKAFNEVHWAPGRVFTSVDTLINQPGPFAPIWRSSGSSRRTIWPDAGVPIASDESAGDSTTRELRV
jgi:hypothetical protein